MVVHAILGQTTKALTDHYSLVDLAERRSTAEAMAGEFRIRRLRTDRRAIGRQNAIC